MVTSYVTIGIRIPVKQPYESVVALICSDVLTGTEVLSGTEVCNSLLERKELPTCSCGGAKNK